LQLTDIIYIIKSKGRKDEEKVENSKKKKIILISSIGAVVLLISLLLILFFVTDIFKSPQQLFYKYLPQNIQLLDIVSSDLKPSYDQKLQQNTYTSVGEASLVYEMGNVETHEETAMSDELFKVITEGKVDNVNKIQNNKVTITKDNQELLSVKYIRNGELYALGSDQIVTKYVAVENNNLKDFATKLGYQDVSQIPNKLEENYNLYDLLQLTDEEKQIISENYGTLIVKNIDKNKFTRTKKIDLTIDGQNYESQKYTLALTSQEVKELMVQVLHQLQNDDKTLNIILNKYYTVAQNQEMTIDSLKLQIQQLQQNITDQQIQDLQVQISLYVSDNKLLKTEIGIGEKLISIQYTTGTREDKVVIRDESNNKENQQFDMLELKESENEEQYVLSAVLSSLGNQQNTVTLQISRVGNINSDTIRNLIILKVTSENDTYTIKYSNNIDYGQDIILEELTQDNYEKLNDYTKEDLQQLITAIIQRTNQVWNENLAKVGLSGENEVSIESIDNQENGEQLEEQQEELSSAEKLAIEMFNEQFLAYLGEKVQADDVKQLLQVTKTEIQNQNPIIVKYSGTYNNTEINKEVTTAEEIENLEVYIVNGKSYFVQGTADTTGKLAELEIKENTNNT